MDLYKHNIAGLKALWDSDSERQNVQLVLLKAFSSTDIDIKTATSIFDTITQLVAEEPEELPRKDPAI